MKASALYINDKTTTKDAKIEFSNLKIWTLSEDKWINPCFRESLLSYWPRFYITTEVGSRFKCSSIFRPKLRAKEH